MPGARYTQKELAEMSREDFEKAAANGFERATTEHYRMPEGADLLSATPTQINFAGSAPRPVNAPAPRDDVWASASTTYDFVCPSGQRCQLRTLSVEKLLEAGILDQITRLEGMADKLVQRAQGMPPSKLTMPSAEELASLLEVINKLMPIAVAQPFVYGDPVPENVPDGAVHVSQIDLGDRIAIMERALAGLRGLDSFRNP